MQPADTRNKHDVIHQRIETSQTEYL